MPSRWRIRRVWIRVIFGAGLLALASLGLGEVLLRRALPDELRYVPREAVLLVAAGQIAPLWETVDDHLGRAMRERESEDEQGKIEGYLRELGSDLEVEKLGDLDEKLGLDTDRGVLIAGVPKQVLKGDIREDLDWIVVLPVASRERFLPDDPEPSPCESLPEVDVYETDEGLAAFRENDSETEWAVMADSCELLSRSIGRARENLRYQRARYPLYRAASRLNGPLLRGARVFVFANAAISGAPVRDVALSLHLGPDAIRLRAIADLFDDQVRLVNELLADPPPEAPGRDLLDADSPGVLLVRDAALGRYLRFAGLDEALANVLDRHFGSLFGAEETRGSVTQVVQALAGYEDGAIRGVLGIWARDRETIDEMVTGSQVRLRERRDRALLAQAGRGYRRTGEAVPITFAALREAGLLEEEPDGLLSRYPIREGECWGWIGQAELRVSDIRDLEDQMQYAGLLEDEPDAVQSLHRILGKTCDVEIGEANLGASDLRLESYRRELGDEEIRYLAPALSDNDLRWRVDVSELTEEERADVVGNRRRLASWTGEDVLWVSLDELDLDALIDRAVSPDAPMRASRLTEPLGPRSVVKAELLFDIQSAFDEGELGLDRESWGEAQPYLWDFRFHRTAEATFRPDLSERRLHLDAEIRK